MKSYILTPIKKILLPVTFVFVLFNGSDLHAQCNCDTIIDTNTFEFDGTSLGTPTSDYYICLAGQNRGTLKLSNLQGDSNASFIVIPQGSELTIRPDSNGMIYDSIFNADLWLSDSIKTYNSLIIKNSNHLVIGKATCQPINFDTSNILNNDSAILINKININNEPHLILENITCNDCYIANSPAFLLNGELIYNNSTTNALKSITINKSTFKHLKINVFNEFHANVFNCNFDYSDKNTFFEISSTESEFNNNLITFNGTFSSNFTFFGQLIKFQNNLLENKSPSIPHISIGADSVFISNNVISNFSLTTSVANTPHFGSILYNTFILDTNIILNAGELNLWLVTSALPQFNVIGNIFYNNSSIYQLTHPFGEYMAFINAEPGSFNNLHNIFLIDTTEINFKNFKHGDYRLKSNSIAIDAGTDSAYTETDLDGNPRLISKRVDCGAYEWYPDKPEAAYDNILLKGLYVTSLDTIAYFFRDSSYLGGEHYNTLIDLIDNYGFNHIIFYRLHNLEAEGMGIDQGTTGTEAVAALIHELKTKHGVLQVAGFGSTYYRFQKLYDYNDLVEHEWSKVFDFCNLEYEYWNGNVCNDPDPEICLWEYVARLETTHDQAHSNNMLVETYIGNIDEGDAVHFAEYADRILVDHYRDWITSDYSNSTIFRKHLYRYTDIHSGDPTTAIMPLFNCRDSNHISQTFLGDTLRKNGVSEGLVFDVWKSGTSDTNILCFYDDPLSCADVPHYPEEIELNIHELPLAGYTWYRDMCFHDKCQEVHVTKENLSTTVTELTTHCLRANTVGKALTFQWYFDSTGSTPIIIPSATESSLCINNFSTNDAGYYYCVVNSPISADCDTLGSSDTTLVAFLSLPAAKRAGNESAKENKEEKPEENEGQNLKLGQESFEVSIFPNPASQNYFKLYSSHKQKGKAEIYTTTGQLVKSLNFAEGLNSFNIRTLNSGLYLVKIQFPDHSQETLKLIVN